MDNGFGFGQTVSVKPVWAESVARLHQPLVPSKPLTKPQEPKKKKKPAKPAKKKVVKKPQKVPKKKVTKSAPRTRDLPWS